MANFNYLWKDFGDRVFIAKDLRANEPKLFITKIVSKMALKTIICLTIINGAYERSWLLTEWY